MTTRRTRRLELETLEHRQLLAGDFPLIAAQAAYGHVYLPHLQPTLEDLLASSEYSSYNISFPAGDVETWVPIARVDQKALQEIADVGYPPIPDHPTAIGDPPSPIDDTPPVPVVVAPPPSADVPPEPAPLAPPAEIVIDTAVRVKITNQAGELVDTIRVGDRFRVSLFVDDLRDVPQGVFYALLDVAYNKDLVRLIGPGEQTAIMQLQQRVRDQGLLDDVGGLFGVNFTYRRSTQIFTAEFEAIAEGSQAFLITPGNALLGEFLLKFGRNTPVPQNEIRFESGNLTIVGGATPSNPAWLTVIGPGCTSDPPPQLPNIDAMTLVLVEEMDPDLAVHGPPMVWIDGMWTGWRPTSQVTANERDYTAYYLNVLSQDDENELLLDLILPLDG